MLVTAAHGDRLTPACASGIRGIFGDINTTRGASIPPPASPSPPGETVEELGAPLKCLSFPLRRVSVLVGAPKANTSQPGVLQGGAVYLCPWGTSPAQCTPIEFDSKGNPLRRSGRD